MNTNSDKNEFYFDEKANEETINQIKDAYASGVLEKEVESISNIKDK